MKKILLLAFNGDPMCFVHVLLNALDMAEKGYDVKVVIEGSATQLIPQLAQPTHQFRALYNEVKQQGLIAAVCKACSAKMQVLEAVQDEGLHLADEMAGHPRIAWWTDQGYEVITF